MNIEGISWEDINTHQSITSLPDEQWVDLTGLDEDRFEISNYGRCRRKPYLDSRNRERDYYVVKISDNGAGYKKFALTINGKLKNVYVHRAVASHFLDNEDNLPQVNHKPSGLGKHDNRVEHLEWCTPSDNIKDAHKNGQMVNRTVHRTKIDVKDDDFISKMYRRYKETGKVGETAREFGVPRTSLSSIVNKRSRVVLTDEIDKEYETKENKMKVLEGKEALECVLEHGCGMIDVNILYEAAYEDEEGEEESEGGFVNFAVNPVFGDIYLEGRYNSQGDEMVLGIDGSDTLTVELRKGRGSSYICIYIVKL